MKNKLIFISLLILILSFAACGGAPPETAVESTTEPVEETQVEPTEEPTEEVQAEPTDSTETESETVEQVEGIPNPTTVEDPSGATIYTYDFGTMTLHAFVNTPEGLGNGTYIIEGATSLVLIDSHFSEASANAFRAYADSLGKPIDRIYATHEHPDHINGLGTAFADLDSYATAGTIELAGQAGISIGNVVDAGSTTIDGINYEFEVIVDTESEEALIIKFPDFDVIATGDLIYNDYHMVMNPNIPNWIDQLAQLEAMSEYKLILPGHGHPAEPAVYAEATAYLEKVWELYDKIDDPDAFQTAIVEAFPDRQAPFLLGLTAQRMYPKPEVYNGPVTEVAIRRIGPDADGFVAAREAYITILKEQSGVVVDREFQAFVDFSTFGEPDPAVFIGMTEYESFDAFGAASGSVGQTEEAGAFFSSFDLEVFAALRPLDPADRYDLAQIGIEPRQVLEVAARDLSSYENFNQADYEASRDAFLEALSQQDGFVQEFQWVSLLDSNIVVGMTVYESAEAYFGIYGGEFGQADVAQAFAGDYPLVAGYANFDARQQGGSAEANLIAVGEQVAFQESIAVHDGIAYLSNFFDGSIHTVDLATGNTETLVEAGNDGVLAGWGLWYDDTAEVLLACANRNPLFGGENISAAHAIDTVTGDILEVWELPAGATCNSILSVANGDIYISDVSPNADLIKIDRATGEVTIWVDEPSWENDSGFGVGGLAWDGDDNLYASVGGPLFRISLNDGVPVPQSFVDSDGNLIDGFGFDGFSYSADSGKLYGAAFNFETFQSLVVAVTPLGDDVVQADVIFDQAIAITGIDVADGNVYAADGQLISALFVDGYEPVTPFTIFQIGE